ncbi:MAG: DJ-1/PfpI family protein [Bifidobacteriaceae bacterium]|jgi:transcriptional regulator GlxA family with amidase domain|nr:DJ-1/PfpI family protein [Bifidobacteriaceae bacterium]
MIQGEITASWRTAPRRVSVLVFEGFELLDAFGPVEVFSQVPAAFTIDLAGLSGQPVRSSQGAQVLPDHSLLAAPAPDIALIPGGPGTRHLTEDESFLKWLRQWAGAANWIASVCTGSALLAAAGLLDGYRATSNKRAFDWVTRFAGPVWERQARWVADRDRWTASGVAAGMDMAVAMVRQLCGAAAAADVQRRIEYTAETDPGHDPFAADAVAPVGALPAP